MPFKMIHRLIPTFIQILMSEMDCPTRLLKIYFGKKTHRSKIFQSFFQFSLIDRQNVETVEKIGDVRQFSSPVKNFK